MLHWFSGWTEPFRKGLPFPCGPDEYNLLPATLVCDAGTVSHEVCLEWYWNDYGITSHSHQQTPWRWTNIINLRCKYVNSENIQCYYCKFPQLLVFSFPIAYVTHKAHSLAYFFTACWRSCRVYKLSAVIMGIQLEHYMFLYGTCTKYSSYKKCHKFSCRFSHASVQNRTETYKQLEMIQQQAPF